MNRNIALLIFALLFSSIAIAQGGDKNMLKTNVAAYALKSINLQYERQFAKKWTAALGFSSIPKSSIAFQSTFDDISGNTQVDLKNLKLGTTIFTPEVRWYVGKKGAFHGFYVAPYARISSYNIDGPINFTAGAGPRTALFTGKLNAVTGGVMIGSNFSLSKRLYLDWWIIGASIGGANGYFGANIALNTNEQSALKSILDDINIPFVNLENSVTPNGATVSTTGGMAGVRGLGINIGIRF